MNKKSKTLYAIILGLEMKLTLGNVAELNELLQVMYLISFEKIFYLMVNKI